MPSPPVSSSPLNQVLQKSLDWIAANDTTDVVSTPTSFFKTRNGVGRTASGSGSIRVSPKDPAADATAKSASTNKLASTSNTRLDDVEAGNRSNGSRLTLALSRSRNTLGSAQFNDNDDGDDHSDVSDYEFYSNPVSEDEYDQADHHDAGKALAPNSPIKQLGGWFPDGQERHICKDSSAASQ
ncbi:hypothetical protein SeMB42_g07664 [Synchytrium endobioticum]|uniref:Uncharacterized protein n=1 Tax=Synchytrium endobioticum TaxID=286115 RepID=A0A507C233_9FUNG|nr:hypothetical protein SeMB42_g07664 [Synchytrium endobioticum]TPX46697.1 hypothetical protein SeLEV6574_g03089 [Synchytrium endobioticum]